MNRAWIFAVCLVLAALLVWADEMIFITYYPAPVGAYKSVTTTGETALARDGGAVTVGSAVSAANLTLAGSMLFGLAGSYGVSPGGQARLERIKVLAGDVEFLVPGRGIVLTSPNGSQARCVRLSNAGSLEAVPLVAGACPP